MPGPLLYVAGAAIAAGVVWLVTMDDGDEPETNGPSTDEGGIAPITIEITGKTTTPSTLPTPIPTPTQIPWTPSVPSTAGWDTNIWGFGNQMKWPGIRAAMVLFGWPAIVGAVDSDINGVTCAPPGLGSRASCTANNGLRNFQHGWNRLIDRANANPGAFIGAPLFAGQIKLVADGILGKNSLNAMSRSMEWQTAHAGGPFGIDNMRLESIQ